MKSLRRRGIGAALRWGVVLGVASGCAVRVVPLADERDGDAGAQMPLPTDDVAVAADRPAEPADTGSPVDAPPPPDVHPAVDAPSVPGRNAVDLLVVVDNSNSMRLGQEFLNNNLGTMVLRLLQTHGVADVRVGVLSTDLGAGGVPVPSCATAAGDDAVLNPRTRGAALALHPPGEGPGELFCRPEVRAAPFLQFGPSHDAMFTYWTPSCHSHLGVGGCGIEQPLEAALRALTTQAAPGGPNAGFLRPEATLAILVLSDEEDGSVRDCSRHDGVGPCDDARDVFRAESARWASPDLNLRFYDYQPGSPQDPTWPLERYVDPARPTRGFLGLKPGHPERVVFGAITGVPQSLPQRPDGSTDWDTLLGPPAPGRPDDFVARDAELAFSSMSNPEGPISMRQRHRDVSCTDFTRMVPACRQAQTQPGCRPDVQPFAWRARRIAEVARRLDASALCQGGPCGNGMVASICERNDSGAFDRFAERIARRTGR